MTDTLCFTLNGKVRQVVGADPHTTLLQYLRGRGLTGTKEGCAEGECGACAVVVVNADLDGAARYDAVNACLVWLPALHGAEILTVEGVACDGLLHPVQQALVTHAASQCGYCTPGFVMSLLAHYYRAPREDPEADLAGNLCRCTGYRPIRDAARALPQVAERDPFAVRLRTPSPVLSALDYDPGGCSYARPTRLDEALRLRAARPRARVVAGGTDLAVEVNQTGVRHAGFLSLEAVGELRTFSARDGGLTLGAGLTFRDLAQHLATRVPMLGALLPLFASPLIRARATLGGNLVTASPVGDSAPLWLALDAQIELASVRGRRRVSVQSFFTGYRTTLLAADELLVAVHVPLKPTPTIARFYKVTKRVVDDISCVSAALALWVDDGVVTRARLAFGGLAETPRRAHGAESALPGAPWDAAALGRVQAALRADFTPMSDVRGSAAYRAEVAASLMARLFSESPA